MFASPFRRRPPGSIVALRVLAWLQLGFALVGLVLVLLFALAASAALDSGDDLTRGFAQLGVFAAVVALVLGVTVVLAIGWPTFLLRTGRTAGKTGALITLATVEALFALVQLGGSLLVFAEARSAGGMVPLVLAAWPVTMVVLAVQPGSRAWAAGRSGPSGAPPPAGGPGADRTW